MDTVQNYKCPCCGAPLAFDGREQNLKCNSCGNEFSADTLEQVDSSDSKTGSESKFDWTHYEERHFEPADSDTLASYTCPSCGAEITGDGAMGAAVCPYCGNSAIIKSQFEGALMPDYLIPFKLDKRAAEDAFKRACGNAPFLPDEFMDKNKIDEMTGIYIPFWMFDCDCSAAVSYSAKRLFSWCDSQYNYVRTDHYRLFREGSVAFENIPVDASKKADDTYMESIEPYDYSEAVDFKTAYLSGFFADKYDVSVEDSIERANARVKNSIEAAFMSTTDGYAAVVPTGSSLSTSNGKIRYSLLPVWMLNIKYNGQIYKYAINGQTGKVAGEYPVSKSKRNKYFAKVFGIGLAVMLCAIWVYTKFM